MNQIFTKMQSPKWWYVSDLQQGLESHHQMISLEAFSRARSGTFMMVPPEMKQVVGLYETESNETDGVLLIL